ncbi:hypothetical protein BaRGS_00022699 [Batillaria attramentaria]|uniref:Macro domain-containing protein n=1 Tax=Batillaria attramentaria TaxID=370345 RepID=A0ABD0KFZ2_9CAEN
MGDSRAASVSVIQEAVVPTDYSEQAVCASYEAEECVEAVESPDAIIDMTANFLPESESDTFVLRCGVTLMICKQNILQTNANAISTSEHKTLTGGGEVSRYLLQTCINGYLEAREQMKQENAMFEYGKVYSCSSGKNETDSNGVAYDTVYHGIVPNAWFFFGFLPTAATLTGKWNKYMRQLYKKLFQKADKDGKSSLALPLFGCGGAGASFDKAIDPLVGSLMNLQGNSPRNLKTIIVCLRQDEAFNKLKAKMKECLRYGCFISKLIPAGHVKTERQRLGEYSTSVGGGSSSG